MKRKLLALAVALVFVLGIVSTGFAADFKDIESADCKDAVTRLTALGIISGFPDGTFRPAEPVTRAQMAKIITTAVGVGEAANYAAGTTKYTDVPASHWASGYINIASDMGIIQGYGDGRFGPEDQVTYAQAITMIVRALGYEPAAQAKGGYPGGYLAVAAENEITEGVTVVAGLAANRGDIAMMVDNSLEVDLMEQTSYGDRPTWEVKEGKNLLNTKLGVKEIKGDVVEISRVNDKLKDNEFKLDDGKTVKTYKLAIDVNTESLFLKEVKIFAKDDKVVWVKVETAEADLVFDTVADAGNESVKLKVKDKEYSWLDEDIEDIEEAKVYVNYVNYELTTEASGLEDAYGLFVFDGKEIKAANLFKFDDIGIVTDVAKDEIEYVTPDNAVEDVILLDDYDAVYVYNPDFTKADLDDIDKNSVICFWANDDDELFIVVVNDAVSGTLTRIRDNKVTVGGKNYDKADEAIVSLNKGKDFDVWGATDDVKDLMDEKVLLLLDLNGEAVAIIGEADVTSDTLYGVVTWAETGKVSTLAIFTAEGKVVEYDLEKRTDIRVGGIDLADDLEYLGTYGNNLSYALVSFELNSDGEIAEGTLKVIKVDATAANPSAPNVSATNVNVGTGKYVIGNAGKDADKAFMTVDSDRIYADKDTLIIKAMDEDELEPEIITYSEFVKMSFDAEDKTYAVVFGEPSKTADMIVFLHKDFDAVKKDVYFGIVTDDAWKVGSNWKVQIDVFEEGKGDYVLKTATDRDAAFKKGTIVAFRLDSNDKVFATTYRVLNGDIEIGTPADDEQIVTGVVYGRDGSFLTVAITGDSKTYKVKDGAVIYVTKDSGAKLDTTLRLSRINKDDKVYMIVNKDEEVVAILVER